MNLACTFLNFACIFYTIDSRVLVYSFQKLEGNTESMICSDIKPEIIYPLS